MHPLEFISVYQIPWRDFRLSALPRDASGAFIFGGRSADDYWGYLEWLADYLYSVKITPSPGQKELCDLVGCLDPEGAMFLLGGYAGIHDDYLIDTDTHLAILERFSGSVTVFNDDDIEWIHKHATQLRQEYDQDSGTDQESSFPVKVIVAVEWHDETASTEMIKQYLTEEAEKNRYFPQGEDCGDLGWRFPLAMVLRTIQEKLMRVKLLDDFFTVLDEFARK